MSFESMPDLEPAEDLSTFDKRPPDECCHRVVTEYAEISVPVEVKPNAMVGKIRTECCGEPEVCVERGKGCDTCEITITQKIAIKIPIKYGVTACVGDTDVECECGCN